MCKASRKSCPRLKVVGGNTSGLDWKQEKQSNTFARVNSCLMFTEVVKLTFVKIKLYHKTDKQQMHVAASVFLDTQYVTSMLRVVMVQYFKERSYPLIWGGSQNLTSPDPERMLQELRLLNILQAQAFTKVSPPQNKMELSRLL